jgi:hypothetical protein
MTQEKKIEYFDIAARIVGFTFKEKDLDLLVNTYDLSLRKGGDTSLSDIAEVKAANELKFIPQEDETPSQEEK